MYIKINRILINEIQNEIFCSISIKSLSYKSLLAHAEKGSTHSTRIKPRSRFHAHPPEDLLDWQLEVAKHLHFTRSIFPQKFLLPLIYSPK